MAEKKPKMNKIPDRMTKNRDFTRIIIYFFIIMPGALGSCTGNLENSTLTATGYDRHVELHWNNFSDNVAYYRVLVGTNGKNFSLRGTVSDTMYLDFVNDLGSDLQLYYKVEAVT